VKEYVTVSRIRATPGLAWLVLTDATAYADWNPEIVGIDGCIALNERITARVRLGSGAIRLVTMQVTTFEPPSRMEWTGGLPLGLFVGRRTFTITPVDGAVEFRMHLRMSGPLAPLILKSVGDRQPEIDGFSLALQAHVEHITVPKSPILDRLHALAVLVPQFETPGFQFGVWMPQQRNARISCYELGETGQAFVDACYSMGWVLSDFDWPTWKGSEEAIRLRDDAHSLAAATADQLARVLTVMIRQERLAEGSLALHVESGLVLNVLRRAASLEAAALTQ